jgi:MOSC domain-containing protein YiiM
LPAPDGRIVAVNVGLSREVSWRGRTFTTAIVKDPVSGSRRIEGVNVVGDDQADRSVHGGPSKAVYAYSMEDYAWWSVELGSELSPGTFGENLTFAGLDVSALPIGEQWQIGSAILEVSEPRVPCYKLGYRMDDPAFPKRFGKAMRFGTYFRIVVEGEVEAGAAVRFHRAAQGPTLPSRDVARIYMFAQDEKHKLVDIPALGLQWRSWGAGLDEGGET